MVMLTFFTCWKNKLFLFFLLFGYPFSKHLISFHTFIFFFDIIHRMFVVAPFALASQAQNILSEFQGHGIYKVSFIV